MQLHRTGFDGFAVDDHRTGPAGAFTASVFGPGQVHDITQKPEERLIFFFGDGFSVENKRRHHLPLYAGAGHILPPYMAKAAERVFCGWFRNLSYNQYNIIQNNPQAGSNEEAHIKGMTFHTVKISIQYMNVLRIRRTSPRNIIKLLTVL